MSATTVGSVPHWILHTQEVLDQAIDKRRYREQVDAFKAVTDDLESELQHLRVLGTASDNGHGSWWSGLPTPPELRNTLRAAADKGTQRDLDRLVRLLKAHREMAAEQAKEAWRAHVDSRIASASALRDIVPYLADADGIDVDPVLLDRLLAQVARGQGKVPTTETMSAVEQAALLFAELQAALSQNIRLFLGAAVGGGAALAALTPEVLTWLNTQGLIDKFRIVPGAPAGEADG